MPWVINEAGESVWQDPNQAINDWAAQYYDAEKGTFNIPGVGVVNVASPWADFQNSSAFGSGSTPGAFRSNMFEGGGQVIDTPYGPLFVGKSRQDAPEMSAEPGAGFGGLLPLIVGGGIGAAGAAAGFGLGGLGSSAGALGGAGTGGAMSALESGLGAYTNFGAGGAVGAGSGAAGGIGALNSFDTGAMADILGTNIGTGTAAGGTAGLDQILSGYNPMGDYGEYGGYTAANTVPTGAAATGAGTGSAASSALSRILGGNASTQDWLSLAGQLGSLGLGVYGANQQANATSDLYNRYFDMGAPYRASLQQLNDNPASFYSSPMFQGALQQGSDALSRSLSAKVGNPILNPTALQEMQNYTTRGSLDAYNQRWNQLASAGQLGVGQAAGLGSQAAAAQGGTANALGAGLSSVFGKEKDYAQQVLDLLKNRSGFSGISLA